MAELGLPSTSKETTLRWILKGNSEWQRRVMGQTLELAAADVGSGPSLVPPCCVSREGPVLSEPWGFSLQLQEVGQKEF